MILPGIANLVFEVFENHGPCFGYFANDVNMMCLVPVESRKLDNSCLACVNSFSRPKNQVLEALEWFENGRRRKNSCTIASLMDTPPKKSSPHAAVLVLTHVKAGKFPQFSRWLGQAIMVS